MCLCSVLVEDSKEAEELKSAYLDYRRLKNENNNCYASINAKL